MKGGTSTTPNRGNIKDLPQLSHDDALARVEESLRTGARGVLFLRASDGESFALVTHTSPEYKQLLNGRIGWTASSEEYRIIREQIARMLPRVQYLGVHLYGPLKSTGIEADDTWALQRTTSVYWPTLLYQPDFCAKAFARWFALAPQIGLITCRTEVAATIAAAYPEKAVAIHPVPSEGLFRPQFSTDEDRSARHHYPHYVKSICAALAETVVPSSLWLVGAGLMKFFYAEVIQDRGGICLDVGSAFDFWEGKITRHDRQNLGRSTSVRLTLALLQEAKVAANREQMS